MGGKPRKAFYFVGANAYSQQLIFLDPHLVNKYVPDIGSSNRPYYE